MLADYVAAHYYDMLSFYGVESGVRQARKHLGWYLDRHATVVSPELRLDYDGNSIPADVLRSARSAFSATGRR